MSEFNADNAGLNELLAYVRTLSGADLSPKRDISQQRLSAMAKKHGLSSLSELAYRVRSQSELRQELINLITVNETYFYRELAQLKQVVECIRLMRGGRVLCAPCSSGDEAYSLAMLCVEAGVNKNEVSLMGIDINSQAIAQCNMANYSERSLHRLSEQQKSRFFNKDGDRYFIKKELLPRVEFRLVNVFDDALFNLGKFDIVLSRNMMIYFDDDFRLKCVERLGRLLETGGRLYTGHADLVPATPMYKKLTLDGIAFYEKV